MGGRLALSGVKTDGEVLCCATMMKQAGVASYCVLDVAILIETTCSYVGVCPGRA